MSKLYQLCYLKFLVHLDGHVCISILHPPSEDPNGYEVASEWWTPMYTVEFFVLRAQKMLALRLFIEQYLLFNSYTIIPTYCGVSECGFVFVCVYVTVWLCLCVSVCPSHTLAKIHYD